MPDPVSSSENQRRRGPRAGVGARRFGRVNWIGLRTLIRREVQRFLTVYGQTLLAPLATALLFLLVFDLAFGARRAATAAETAAATPFIAFLAPGVVMMTVLQNAFANTSSSVASAKVHGAIVDTLTPPLSPAEIALGLALGGVARGLAVAAICGVALFSAAEIGLARPLWALFFALAGSALLALMGVAAAIWAVKFDHLAAVGNFVITPLSFLSGAFYSIRDLPPEWRAVSQANPFFHLIDGFRYGALGVSDGDPWTAAAVALAAIGAAWLLVWRMIAVGYRLKT